MKKKLLITIFFVLLLGINQDSLTQTCKCRKLSSHEFDIILHHDEDISYRLRQKNGKNSWYLVRKVIVKKTGKDEIELVIYQVTNNRYKVYLKDNWKYTYLGVHKHYRGYKSELRTCQIPKEKILSALMAFKGLERESTKLTYNSVQKCWMKHGTPLMNAAYLGNIEAVKVLLDAGADKTITNDKDKNLLPPAIAYPKAIDYALENGHLDIVTLLRNSNPTN